MREEPPLLFPVHAIPHAPTPTCAATCAQTMHSPWLVLPPHVFTNSCGTSCAPWCTLLNLQHLPCPSQHTQPLSCTPCTLPDLLCTLACPPWPTFHQAYWVFFTLFLCGGEDYKQILLTKVQGSNEECTFESPQNFPSISGGALLFIYNFGLVLSLSALRGNDFTIFHIVLIFYYGLMHVSVRQTY